MSLKSIAMAACVVTMTATSGFAATLDYTFSFTGVDDGDNGTGSNATVTGLIVGLEDDATSSATSVSVDSNTSGWGVQGYDILSGLGFLNSFTVAGGVITGASFSNKGLSDDLFQLQINTSASGDLTAMLIQSDSFGFKVEREIEGTLSFEPVTSGEVPVPAAGLLLLTGIAGAAALRRKKKAAA